MPQGNLAEIVKFLCNCFVTFLKRQDISNAETEEFVKSFNVIMHETHMQSLSRYPQVAPALVHALRERFTNHSENAENIIRALKLK